MCNRVIFHVFDECDKVHGVQKQMQNICSSGIAVKYVFDVSIFFVIINKLKMRMRLRCWLHAIQNVHFILIEYRFIAHRQKVEKKTANRN